MSEPAWVALGAQPVDYEGAWAAGTQYAPGDVVRHGGVDYLAVNPSLGSTPPTAVQPSQELAYGQFTAAVVANGTTEAGATQIVAAPAVVLDGVTPVFLDFFCPAFFFSDLPDATLYLFDGSTPLGQAWFMPSSRITSGVVLGQLTARRRLTPAAGSHVFSARGKVTSGAGITCVAGTGAAGDWMPGFIRVTR